MDYKRLGDYIREVNVRNKDLKVTNLEGVSISKQFIPSIANTIGTDMSTYKVVNPGQFAYGPVTSRNGDKVSIALYKGDDDAIISQAYTVFEVVDKDKMSSEYLMMWFQRPEFDRYARFHSHGSAREIFDWDELCDVYLPLPDIARQREIVEEYETLSRRIRLNEQMIEKLEATAQALYRKMFVDGIDKENLPEGWRIATLGEFCEINTDNYTSKYNHSVIRYLDSSSVTENDFDDYQILKVGEDEIPSRAKRKVRLNDIVYSTVRPNLKHYGLIKGEIDNVVVSTAFAVIRSNNPDISNELLYMWLIDDTNTELLQGIAEMSKATYPSITNDNIQDLKIAVPQKMDGLFSELNNQLGVIFDSVDIYHSEIKKLSELQSLLLVKMGNLKQ